MPPFAMLLANHLNTWKVKEPHVDPETASGYMVSPVTVFPDIVRNELVNRSVKTNLTIPAWLKEITL